MALDPKLVTMRPIFLLCILTACAATPKRERVLVEFEPRSFAEMSRALQRRFDDLAWFGGCALPPGGSARWAPVSTIRAPPIFMVEGLALPSVPCEAQPSEYLEPFPDFPWTSEADVDLLGVEVTPDFERSTMLVETRHGDWGGLERVVAWLEACGGKQVTPQPETR